MQPDEVAPHQILVVRTLIADVDVTREVMTDAQLRTLIAHADGSTYGAAADALLTIAASETLLSKKLTTQDLATDGPAVADALRQLSREYSARAERDRARSQDVAGDFFFMMSGGADPCL